MNASSLVVSNIGFSAGRASLLRQVSASFEAGRVTAILGPNGAGKSTFMSLISGQSKPSAGQVRMNCMNIASVPMTELAKVRSFVPQDSQVAFDFSVREIVELGRYPHRAKPGKQEAQIVPKALSVVNVLHLADRVYNTLSGGERARVQVARALAQIWEPSATGHARWLMLDEPTAALDLAHQHQVMSELRGWAVTEGVGIVTVLHDVNLALRYADDVLLLRGGESHGFGSARSVLTAETVSDLWQVDCQSVPSSDGVPQYIFSAQSTALVSA